MSSWASSGTLPCSISTSHPESGASDISWRRALIPHRQLGSQSIRVARFLPIVRYGQAESLRTVTVPSW